MANIASALRDEISRLARKEIRQQVEPLRKTNAQLRRTVAALKSELAGLQRSVGFLKNQEKRRLESPPASEPDARPTRFSPAWVKKDRARLGLSAADYGRLIGVSALTVYSWENGKSRPRAERLAAWGEVRGIGKREAQRRLELLGGGSAE